MEVAMTNYTPSKFAADNALTDTDVIEKYKLSANIVNAVLPQVLDKVAVGISVCDLCQFGDDLITAYADGMYKSMERGIAFPTCVSVNNYVQYMSPMADTDYSLQPGDVVKVELGAHINGYISTAAHTVVVNANPEQPIQNRAADVICAAYCAQEAALRLLKPGVKASEITRAITEIGLYYRCQPVEGTYSSPMKRFVLRGGKDIENRFANELFVEDLERFDFEIEANQVYQLNIVMTTGDGKVKPAEHKPCVFQRDVNKSYQLKMKAARTAYNEINSKYTVFPFASRSLSTNHARLGLTSLMQHELITPYTPMRSSLKTDLVAQFKLTVLVTPKGLIRTTLPMALPYVHSQYCIPEQTPASQILASEVPLEIIKPVNEKSLPQVNINFGEHRIAVC
ncbi:peptidase M24, structural domain-containing protein [Zychaea mexicana]|uniref:peptidase M24, structural domain-containing protein n=1 Tax=Zychaea mexicana TaxID=64656 RepID=UPI0022FE80C0|nr:peptidase M24, structural domain-containing protein [Zychaea mexicana]KAI9488147.1 peptidase M24, structural domain-containing protein [Zychaea mexicana]